MTTKPEAFLSFGWPTEELQKLSDRDYALEIEAVSEGYPVVMFDGSGHNAVCNRTALEKAGLINDKGERIRDVLEMEAQEKQKEIFRVNVANTWFEGKQVYQK